MDQDLDKNLKQYRKNLFRTEVGYFDELEERINQQTFPREGFNIPEGYFEDLQESLIDEKTDMHVPAGYFDKLQATIEAEVTPKKIISLKRVAYWLSAACIVGVIFMILQKSEQEECKTFACLLKESELTDEELLQLYDHTIVEDLLNEGQAEEEESDAYLEYLIDSDYPIETLLEDE